MHFFFRDSDDYLFPFFIKHVIKLLIFYFDL